MTPTYAAPSAALDAYASSHYEMTVAIAIFASCLWVGMIWFFAATASSGRPRPLRTASQPFARPRRPVGRIPIAQ